MITVAVTTVMWIAATLIAAPAEREKLVSFYRLVRPAGPGWRDIRAESGLPPSPDSLPQALLGWVLGCLFVYSALFGTGSFIYGRRAQGFVWTAAFVISSAVLIRLLPRMWGTKLAADSEQLTR